MANHKYFRLLPLSFALAAIPLVYAQTPVAVSVDVAAKRHPINPGIYGVNLADTAPLLDLNAPLNRYGGNNTSRYNWQLNADNRGADWYFESIAEANATAGARGDSFMQASRAANAQAMITVPIIDWVAKLGTNRSKLASFSVRKYGAQTGTDAQWYPDAGNGVLSSNGQNISNDPNDANTPNSVGMQQQWAQHLLNTFGAADNGGLKYYILDNEHSIWFSTHRDAAPTGATMDEIHQKMVDYASAIKAVDPKAMVVGPEEWGWSGYLYSGYDQQYMSQNGWGTAPDRIAHGNQDYVPWLLAQMKAAETQTGVRLLDVFSLHYYPQGGEFSDDTSSTMQLRRNRSTRSLWDPNYTDETWIADKVKLIPRMKGWLASYYPGLQTAITEYNWGAENHINGATTQADILGIFGREGLDLATRWTTPAATTPTYKAMKMYRNYDGNKSSFGDTSVSAATANPDNLSAFAAQRSSDGAVTVMTVNKVLSGSTALTLNVSNFSAGTHAKVYQLTAANAISALADVAVTNGVLNATLPAQSVTLFVIGGNGNQAPVAAATATPGSGLAPLPVAFDATGSSDADGTIASYAWKFGDGASASGVTASHTYAAAGSYAATLTVTDNGGASASTTVNITVNAPANQAPVARIAATPTAGMAPLLVNFDGRTSSDADGSITSYAWIFGDGSSASGATASHSYAAAGTYTAKLTVTDNGGATASTTVLISASADTNVIKAPSSLGASAKNRVASLSWRDNSSNEQGFAIERAPYGSSAFLKVGQVGANVRSYSEAVLAGRYVYRVRAFNTTTGRYSAYSNSANLTVR
ncbi:MAG: glycoside hydrolase family 44 protein [Pseudomonadota bacterium]